MKKTYMIPTLKVVKIQPAQVIATSVNMYGSNAEGAAMGRQAGFSDDDDDWED